MVRCGMSEQGWVVDEGVLAVAAAGSKLPKSNIFDPYGERDG